MGPSGLRTRHPGKELRNNVGKVPRAAEAGSNLQRLLERGYKPKERRARWDWRMSPQERRRRSNVLPGGGIRLPDGGNAPTSGKGTLGLGESRRSRSSYNFGQTDERRCDSQ